MVQLTDDVRARMVDTHRSLGTAARLYNFDFAVRTKTADGREATWVPVQPSAAGIGGRPSIYDLAMNTETRMGTYITASGIVHEDMTRTAEDTYEVKQVDGAGTVLYSGSGTLEVLNGDIGYGRIGFEGDLAKSYYVWILWSLIRHDWVG